MTRLALLNPTSLLAKELIERLDQRPELWQDLALLSLDEKEIGALTDAAGEAAVVQRAEPEAIAGADVVVVCGDSALYRDLIAQRGRDSTVILLDPGAEDGEAVAVVAGVNSDLALPGRVLLSPHPGTVLLSHLLAPLVPVGITAAVATLVQPASIFDHSGLDELFAQAGRLVALQGQEPSDLFGGQLAFNLYPAPQPATGLVAPVRRALGVDAADLPLAAHLLQGAVFHGLSALVHLRTAEEVTVDEIGRRLATNPAIELSEAAGHNLGPIDVAAHDTVIVGPVEADPDGGLWIWAVMDNLTRGGAVNALAILEQVLATRVH